ncbi:hypothetical protein SRHO_G00215280 [Serrasalmus rhombeus]
MSKFNSGAGESIGSIPRGTRHRVSQASLQELKVGRGSEVLELVSGCLECGYPSVTVGCQGTLPGGHTSPLERCRTAALRAGMQRNLRNIRQLDPMPR